jgi:uncharacterized protein with NRDE domain
MCVAAIAWQAHPRWRVVAIGNRDEYHARAAAPLARWSDRRGVIAGRDLPSGGTWLGVGEANARLALVTNLPSDGAPDPEKASRGTLVGDLLTGAGRYADPATADLAEFNPMNLICVEGHRAHFLTNRPEPLRAELAPGLYGLSNGALDEPWAKVLQLKAALLDWLTKGDGTFEPLFATLRDDRLRHAEGTPAPEQTPPFIRDPVYGTRCSTVAAIDHAGRGTIIERSFDAAGAATGNAQEDFAWSALALGKSSS